jgi:hypothetical protein
MPGRALVFIITNLGLAFGDTTTISLAGALIFVIIAFSIISAYFSSQTVTALGAVADWLVRAVRGKIGAEEIVTPADNPAPES